MTDKLSIKDFSSSDKKIAAVKRAEDKTALKVEVKETGKMTLTLTAEDGTVEEFVLTSFPTDLILTEGESGKLRMSKNQPIQIIHEIPGGNEYLNPSSPPEISIKAKEAGLLRVILRSVDGSVEEKLVGVKPKK
jgi:hypothetical protein